MSMAQSEAVTHANDTESRGSLAPLLPGSFPQESEPTQSLSNLEESTETAGSAEDPAAGSGKSSKRPFWKLGKKTAEEKNKEKGKSLGLSKSNSPPHIAPIGVLRPVSPMRAQETGRVSISSQRGHPYGSPGSPAYGGYSSSPRLHSPASSQIFERNVQEDVLPPQASPQIPSHIITENHIPPAWTPRPLLSLMISLIRTRWKLSPTRCINLPVSLRARLSRLQQHPSSKTVAFTAPKSLAMTPPQIMERSTTPMFAVSASYPLLTLSMLSK
jgi:hypothetical protein